MDVVFTLKLNFDTNYGKVIHWELCQRSEFKFEHTKKSYMHSPESVTEKRCTRVSWILRYKPITLSRKDSQTK